MTGHFHGQIPLPPLPRVGVDKIWESPLGAEGAEEFRLLSSFLVYILLGRPWQTLPGGVATQGLEK